MTSRCVKLGDRTITFPSDYLQQLKPDNQLLGDRLALLQQLDKKGYLYIQGLHNRDEVLAARMAVINYIDNYGQGKFDKSKPIEQGQLDARCGHGCIPFMEGRNDVTHSEVMSKVLEGKRPKEFFRTLFNEDVKTFDYKWLRGVHREAFTGAHVDSVYMCRGTQHLYTMWTPFDDVPVEMGTLAVCEGSHRLDSFQKVQETYGSLDVERDNLQGTGWFTTDPYEITQRFGGQWKTADFKAGDVLIFTIRTFHMSTANLTDRLRISCDTRWLKASDSADPRYMGQTYQGQSKYGEWAEQTDKPQNHVTIEQLKNKWGFVGGM